VQQLYFEQHIARNPVASLLFSSSVFHFGSYHGEVDPLSRLLTRTPTCHYQWGSFDAHLHRLCTWTYKPTLTRAKGLSIKYLPWSFSI